MQLYVTGIDYMFLVVLYQNQFRWEILWASNFIQFAYSILFRNMLATFYS